MEVKEVALKFNDCVNSQDLDGISELMSENFRFVGVEGEGFQGREKSVKIWMEFFFEVSRVLECFL
ncbi:MAG: nuclear transport factor 2 family protein [archaeon]